MINDDSYMAVYLQDWLANIRQIIHQEQQVIDGDSEFRAPYAAVPRDTMQALFSICDKFEVEAEVKYLAVHLFHRYLGRMMWEASESQQHEVTHERLEVVRQEIASQHKLELASCLQIASKIDLSSNAMSVDKVQLVMNSMDPGGHYPRQAIMESELKVLCKLDYRRPMAMPLNVLELLLANCRLPRQSDPLRATCLKLLDTVYMRHENLFGLLHYTALGFDYDQSRPECREFMRHAHNAAFVAAAVLLCCALVFRVNKALVDIVFARLVELFDLEIACLGEMVNLLFVSVVDEEDIEAVPSDDDANDEHTATGAFFSQFADFVLQLTM